jgi:hypothetical protein
MAHGSRQRPHRKLERNTRHGASRNVFRQRIADSHAYTDAYGHGIAAKFHWQFFRSSATIHQGHLLHQRLSPKEAKALEQIGRRLLKNPPEYLRRKIMEKPAGPQLVSQQIPLEKLLQQYGKTHLQLTVTDEQLGQARQIIEILQKQCAQQADKLIEAQKELAIAQEKLKSYEAAKEAEVPPKEEAAPISDQMQAPGKAVSKRT